jgi:nitrite reductase (cytochrome c-552)
VGINYFHKELPRSRDHGAAGVAARAARAAQRRGGFYVDFVESENSNGFHAPQEAARILGEAIDELRKGQVALRPRLVVERAATAAGR